MPVPPPPSQMPPPPPPPVPVPPPPHKHTHEPKLTQKEKDKDRHRRGLPYLRDQHVCSNLLFLIKIFGIFLIYLFALVCSKTIWLGHLSKSTTEDLVIDEISELLSPSSSSNDSDSNKKKLSRNKNYQNIILDVHVSNISFSLFMINPLKTLS